MSKKVYVGNHVANTIYVAMNGVLRKVVAGYVGIDGINRKFFGTSPTWERYAVVAETYYINNISSTKEVCYSNSQVTTSYSDVYTPGGTWSKMSFSESTGEYTFSSRCDIKLGDDSYYQDNPSSMGMNYGECDGLFPEYKTGHWKISNYKRTSTTVGRKVWYGLTVYGYRMTAVQATRQIKGDYIDTITANSADAFPSDGVQGDYWYVYVGER